MKTYLVLGSGFALGLVTAEGCAAKAIDPLHCANNDGDAYCAGQFDDGVQRYCQRGIEECYTPDSQYGCVEQRPADECYSPCGGRSTIAENGSCVMEEESSSGSSSGTETEGSSSGESSSSTTGPMPCVSDEECTDAAAPFCGVTGECGSCSGTTDPDGACAGVDPLLPLCIEGACVACTPENPVVCDEQLLLCDGGTNTCVPCTEHAQCGSGACELAVGTCFPPDVVVHVDGDEPAMPPMMYASVSAAVASIGMGMHGVIVVHELDGEAPYLGAVTIDGDKVIALLAAPGEAPMLQGTAGNPGLAVEGAGTILYMDGLTVSLSPGVGLQVDDAFAWVDRSRIVQNTGGGVLAENGAELTLRNCFVGQDATSQVAIAINGSNALILNATVLGGFGMGTVALECTGANTVEVRNSVFATLSSTPELACPGASISHSAAEASPGGEGSIALGNVDETIMAGLFDNYAGGDFHLATEGMTALADVALWTTGDPPSDIDGDPRPAIDGTPDYAGADVP